MWEGIQASKIAVEPDICLYYRSNQWTWNEFKGFPLRFNIEV